MGINIVPTTAQILATSAIAPTTAPASTTATFSDMTFNVAAIADEIPSTQPPIAVVQIFAKTTVQTVEPVTFGGVQFSNANHELFSQEIIQLGPTAFNLAKLALNVGENDSLSSSENSMRRYPVSSQFAVRDSAIGLNLDVTTANPIFNEPKRIDVNMTNYSINNTAEMDDDVL
ncbi:hypothetical protein HDU99_003000, partial [Rhizoclosmatium hyalinum]